jgi:hypothetical protein
LSTQQAQAISCSTPQRSSGTTKTQPPSAIKYAALGQNYPGVTVHLASLRHALGCVLEHQAGQHPLENLVQS